MILTQNCRRLSELEQETVELRQRLEQRTSWSGSAATPPASVDSVMPHQMTPLMTPLMNGNRALPPARINSIVSPPTEDGIEEQPPPTPLLTQSQGLEGVAVSAGVIDELFKMYGLAWDPGIRRYRLTNIAISKTCIIFSQFWIHF